MLLTLMIIEMLKNSSGLDESISIDRKKLSAKQITAKKYIAINMEKYPCALYRS